MHHKLSLLAAVLACLLFNQDAKAQAAQQTTQLPFQLVQPNGSTLLMQQYFPGTSFAYAPQNQKDGAPIQGMGQMANFFYVIPNGTFPEQIIESYRVYLEPLGYKVTLMSWDMPNDGFSSNPTSLCGVYAFCGKYRPSVNKARFPDMFCSKCGQFYTSQKSLVMVNAKPEGNIIFALYSVQVKSPTDFLVPDEQKNFGLVASKSLVPGDNLLLISVSWPQSVIPNFVQADSGLSKPTEAPAVAAQPETAAVISKELHEHGKINIYGLLFDFNKADLKPESSTTLRALAETLQKDPTMNVLIVGHTDNVGGENYNQKLSTARAANVAQALVRDYHIAANRLTAVGKGFSEPIASNDTDDGRAKNRRVEFKVVQ